MPSTEVTLYEIRKGAAWITLNRPERRNALSGLLISRGLRTSGRRQRGRSGTRGGDHRCRTRRSVPARI